MRKLMSLLVAVFPIQAAAKSSWEAPALFSMLSVSPAQQADEDKTRVEGGLLYGMGDSKDKADSTTSTNTMRQTVLRAGTVVPVTRALKAGFVGVYDQFNNDYKFEYEGGEVTGSGKVKLLSGAPMAAFAMTQNVAFGAEYVYLDAKSESDDSDETTVWGHVVRVGTQLRPMPTMTLGLVYQSRMGRIAAPAALTIHGAMIAGKAGSVGMTLVHRLNSGVDEEMQDATDAAATFSTKMDGSSRLIVLAGYMPATMELAPTEVWSARYEGYGPCLGVEYVLGLNQGTELGFGLTYSKLGKSIDGDLEATLIRPAVRVATHL